VFQNTPVEKEPRMSVEQRSLSHYVSPLKRSLVSSNQRGRLQVSTINIHICRQFLNDIYQERAFMTIQSSRAAARRNPSMAHDSIIPSLHT
jgi:hypothetical protein